MDDPVTFQVTESLNTMKGVILTNLTNHGLGLGKGIQLCGRSEVDAR